MHIDVVPNRGSRPAYLLREAFREGAKVRKRTLANLSSLPDDQIEAIRRVLRGESLAAVTDLFEIISSRIHGDTHAVLAAMRRLGIRKLLSSRPSWEADVVMGMVAARVVAPHTKLATTRWWHTHTLPEDLHIAHAKEYDLYQGMDWLLEHQETIEKKLAARHLQEGGLALYDLSSSYFEGKTCPLAAIGHNRDGKKNKLQVNYGLLTDRRGCPVAVSVYEGNTGDAKTLMPQVEKLKKNFGLERVVLVGDRGMIGQAAVEDLRNVEGLEWITALKSGQIRGLVEGGALQLGLFDKRNLFELSHPDYPGERLMACRNVELGKLRAHKRQSLLDATVKELEKVRAMVNRGDLIDAGKIGLRAGRVVNKYKVAKHFDLTIEDARFAFALREESVHAEAALDGIYVIRTSLSKSQMSTADTVRSYKALAEVERAFRTLKTVDLEIRPIHHRLADRVKAHIFLCMLAYYVEWHMREAWRSLLFSDEDLAAKATRDPVAPAKRSEAAEEKAASKNLPDGTRAHSFRTLMEDLSTIVRNTCRTPGRLDAPTFTVLTTPTAAQQRAMDLLEEITV
ncbi:MAG: IS1634 family transposase [Deltaproteobacteria bacterium]